MADSEKQQKFYYYLGKVVWFILRWLFYGVLFYIAFMMGGKQGSMKERAKQVEFPKIKVEFPTGGVPTAGNHSPPPVNSYIILVGSFSDLNASQDLQEQLNAARINSYLVEANGAYYVCVGKYKSEKKANSVLKQVHEKGFTQATVVVPSSLVGTF